MGYDGFRKKKGTKIHVCVNENGKPLAIEISPGNENNSKMLIPLVLKLKNKPNEIYADSMYDNNKIREKLESMNIKANIPINPRNGRENIPYNKEKYKVIRSAVERFFSFLKRFRRVIIRYERLAIMYKAIVTIASILIHLRMK
ncbi:MAG: transposase [Candidatus Methanomethylicaceae archaeon]